MTVVTTPWVRNNNTSESIGFRCSPELRSQLWQEASARGTRPGPYIRQILEAHMAELEVTNG